MTKNYTLREIKEALKAGATIIEENGVLSKMINNTPWYKVFEFDDDDERPWTVYGMPFSKITRQCFNFPVTIDYTEITKTELDGLLND